MNTNNIKYAKFIHIFFLLLKDFTSVATKAKTVKVKDELIRQMNLFYFIGFLLNSFIFSMVVIVDYRNRFAV